MRHAANFGIGGDQTQHALWRIEHGELDATTSRVVVLPIGTNNLRSNPADEVAAGITVIVQEIRKRLPETKILLLGVFPRSERPGNLRRKLEAVNRQIAQLDDASHVIHLDISRTFLNPDDTLSRPIMPDFLHLSTRGYRIWANAMEPTLWRLLEDDHGEKARTTTVANSLLHP